MPLPNLLKSIIGSLTSAFRPTPTLISAPFLLGIHGKEKMSISANARTTTKPSTRQSTLNQMPHQLSSGAVQYPPPHQKAKPRSLSLICGIHAHSNLKIQHQLQLAETMYDPSLKTSLHSRLSHNFEKCLSDDFNLPYFLQYIESLDQKCNAKNVVTCFLQLNCLLVFLKENFPHIDFDSLDEFETVALNTKQNESFALFINDFRTLYQHFSLLNCDDSSLEIEEDLRNQLSLLFEDLKDPAFQLQDHALPLELFYLFWKSLHTQIESRYYELFLRSPFFLKYEVDVLKSKGISLPDILYSSTAIASTFLDFMNSENMKRFVDFCLMHKNYKSYSGQHSDALALYERFFNFANKSSSNAFLDFSEDILGTLKLETNKDTFNPDCFDSVAFILIQYFSKTYLPQFLQSDTFREYIDNCEVKIRAEKSSLKAHSCAGVPKLAKQESNASSHSNDQTDSESLWKRTLKGQLQFTYIDNYGRMNSLFEPEPARDDSNGSSGGKLTNVIKRLTSNATEEKKKEDDAWRIAESIINDVCSVTIDPSEASLLARAKQGPSNTLPPE